MKVFLGFVLATIFWITLLAIVPMPPSVIRYDCTIAEFHPDIPPHVKEKCRRLKNDPQPKEPPSPGRIVL